MTAQDELDKRDFSEYPAMDQWKKRALQAEKRVAELEYDEPFVRACERIKELEAELKRLCDNPPVCNCGTVMTWGWQCDYCTGVE